MLGSESAAGRELFPDAAQRWRGALYQGTGALQTALGGLQRLRGPHT